MNCNKNMGQYSRRSTYGKHIHAYKIHSLSFVSTCTKNSQRTENYVGSLRQLFLHPHNCSLTWKLILHVPDIQMFQICTVSRVLFLISCVELQSFLHSADRSSPLKFDCMLIIVLSVHVVNQNLH